MTRLDSYRKKVARLRALQLQHMKKQLEGREAIRGTVRDRNKFIETQNRLNYINEYDRVKNELGQTLLDSRTKDQLVNRSAHLKKLFSNGNI